MSVDQLSIDEWLAGIGVLEKIISVSYDLRGEEFISALHGLLDMPVDEFLAVYRYEAAFATL